ncbi:MAG: hypothetical protein KJ709_09075, partial [Nanoarchaeota archaeon]|nr:hypothetical protein [Nanoarchaeota archaeon]
MIAAADEEIKYTKADLAYRLTVNLAPMEKLVKSTREFDQLLDWKDRMMHSADEHDEHAAKVLPFAKVSLANALRNPNNFQSSMDTAGFMGQTVNSWLIRNEATGALTTPDTARYTDRIMNQRRMKSTMKRWNSLIAAFNRYLKERFLISPNDLVHVNLQELMLARGVVHG